MACIDGTFPIVATDEDREAKKAVARRLGAALKRVRVAARVSGADLGTLIEKGQAQISKWETGENLLQLHQIERIEDALQVTPGTILAEAGFIATPSAAIRTLIADDDELEPVDREWIVRQFDSSWRRSHGLRDGDTVR